VEEVGFAAFFADCAECHGGFFLSVLGGISIRPVK